MTISAADLAESIAFSCGRIQERTEFGLGTNMYDTPVKLVTSIVEEIIYGHFEKLLADVYNKKIPEEEAVQLMTAALEQTITDLKMIEETIEQIIEQKPEIQQIMETRALIQAQEEKDRPLHVRNRENVLKKLIRNTTDEEVLIRLREDLQLIQEVSPKLTTLINLEESQVKPIREKLGAALKDIAPKRAEKLTEQLMPALIQAYAYKDDNFCGIATAPLNFAAAQLDEVKDKIALELEDTEDYKIRYQTQRKAFEETQPKQIAQQEQSFERTDGNTKSF